MRQITSDLHQVTGSHSWSGLSIDTTADVDWLLPHQANERILTATADRLQIPAERCMNNIGRYGNTSSASIPIALDEYARDGRLKRGDLILITAFGGGLTWGAALVRW